MPRDRKETYSDRQSQAARAKKEQAAKKAAPKEGSSQAVTRIVKEASKRK